MNIFCYLGDDGGDDQPFMVGLLVSGVGDSLTERGCTGLTSPDTKTRVSGFM